jgi:hypothetical protein
MRAFARMLSWACHALALAVASMSTASFALTVAEQRAACTSDAFRLCSAQIPNVDAIIACLRREKANLSSECRAVFDAPQEKPVSTRSIATPVNEWCVFARNPDAGDQIWRNWCGEAAR